MTKQLGVLILDKADWLRPEFGPGDGSGHELLSSNCNGSGVSYLYNIGGKDNGCGNGNGHIGFIKNLYVGDGGGSGLGRSSHEFY